MKDKGRAQTGRQQSRGGAEEGEEKQTEGEETLRTVVVQLSLAD